MDIKGVLIFSLFVSMQSPRSQNTHTHIDAGFVTYEEIALAYINSTETYSATSLSLITNNPPKLLDLWGVDLSPQIGGGSLKQNRQFEWVLDILCSCNPDSLSLTEGQSWNMCLCVCVHLTPLVSDNRSEPSGSTKGCQVHRWEVCSTYPHCDVWTDTGFPQVCFLK